MKSLDDLGIADDTIFVFSSDHGDMIGSHRMCLKQEPFEESISIPFIVRYPQRIAQGHGHRRLLSPIDIMPTLLGLADAPIPKSVEGISLADAALGKKSDQQDAVLLMKMVPAGCPWMINAATPWRGVRTKTHTYARLADGGPWVLYDNKADPYQMKNLVNDPARTRSSRTTWKRRCRPSSRRPTTRSMAEDQGVHCRAEQDEADQAHLARQSRRDRGVRRLHSIVFIDMHVHAQRVPGPPRSGNRDFSSPEWLIERYDKTGSRGQSYCRGQSVSPEIYAYAGRPRTFSTMTRAVSRPVHPVLQH